MPTGALIPTPQTPFHVCVLLKPAEGCCLLIAQNPNCRALRNEQSHRVGLDRAPKGSSKVRGVTIVTFCDSITPCLSLQIVQ